MRARKPCFRERRRLLGWKVRFMTVPSRTWGRTHRRAQRADAGCASRRPSTSGRAWANGSSAEPATTPMARSDGGGYPSPPPASNRTGQTAHRARGAHHDAGRPTIRRLAQWPWNDVCCQPSPVHLASGNQARVGPVPTDHLPPVAALHPGRVRSPIARRTAWPGSQGGSCRPPRGPSPRRSCSNRHHGARRSGDGYPHLWILLWICSAVPIAER